MSLLRPARFRPTDRRPPPEAVPLRRPSGSQTVPSSRAHGPRAGGVAWQVSLEPRSPPWRGVGRPHPAGRRDRSPVAPRARPRPGASWPSTSALVHVLPAGSSCPAPRFLGRSPSPHLRTDPQMARGLRPPGLLRRSRSLPSCSWKRRGVPPGRMRRTERYELVGSGCASAWPPARPLYAGARQPIGHRAPAALRCARGKPCPRRAHPAAALRVVHPGPAGPGPRLLRPRRATRGPVAARPTGKLAPSIGDSEPGDRIHAG